MRRSLTLFALLAATLAANRPAGADLIEIKPGDHVAIIGNTLADRMQHDGTLEALIQARHPDHELVIRNLGFPGDEALPRTFLGQLGWPLVRARRKRAA